MPVIAIPWELRRNFLGNRSEFIRNMACWSQQSLSPFYRRFDKIIPAIDGSRENPWDFRHKQFHSDFFCQDNDFFLRYIHFDLAENQDRVGFSMCHAPFFVSRDIVIGTDVNEIRLPYLFFDFIGAIEVSKKEELDFQLIPEIVLELRTRGFVIDLITFDRFQSSMPRQILESEGFHCSKLSIDRTAYRILVRKVVTPKGEPKGWKIYRESTERQYADAHNALKKAVYESRCSIPEWENWKKHHPLDPRHPFVVEARGAENQAGGTVDHGPFSKIDILSGMAGAAYNCQNNSVDVGDRPDDWQDPAKVDTYLLRESQANLHAMESMLAQVSTPRQLRMALNQAEFGPDGQMYDTFDLERDSENNPFSNLGF